MSAAHVPCHPWLLCHASWSVRRDEGVALLKAFVILLSQNPAAGIYRKLCTGVTLPDLCVQVPGAKLNPFHCLITPYKNSVCSIFFQVWTWNSFTNRCRLYSCHKCKYVCLHLNGICTACYLQYGKKRKTRGEEGMSARRWKKASDGDSLMFPGSC